MNVPQGYVSTANELRDRILKLIPDHPEIMDIDSPFDLFKIEGFSTEGLDPTLAQAGWALGNARAEWKKRQEG